MTHESLVSPHSVEQLSPFYKVLRLRPLGMVGFKPTAQIPLTAELHPYGNHHQSLPFRAGEDEGI